VRAAADVLKICVYAAIAGEELGFAQGQSKRPSYQGSGEWLGWALAGALILVAMSFWFGFHAAKPDKGSDAATVIRLAPESGLSQPKESRPQFQSLESSGDRRRLVKDNAVPQRERQRMPTNKPQNSGTDLVGAVTAEQPPKAKESDKTVWSAESVEAASGKVVRVGRFTTAGEAEKGWDQVLRQHPEMPPLTARPVQIKSLRDGHVYYRLQIGTNSSEQSEVICNVVRVMHQSCTIIGTDESTIDRAI